MTSGRRIGTASLRAPALLGICLFLFLTAAYGLTASKTETSIDVVSTDLSAWRIAGTGEPWLDGLRHDYGAEEWDKLWIDTNPDGHDVAYRSSGATAIAVPAYWIAGADGSLASFSNWPGSLCAALLTALAVTLAVASIQPVVGSRAALLGGLALAFTTPMWTVAADSLWTHSVTVFAIGGTAYAASRGIWWLVGVFGGIGLWGRLHTSIITAILALGLAFSRRKPRIAVIVAAIGLAFTLGASLWSNWLYQTWRPGGAYQTTGAAADLADDGWWHVVANELGLWVSLGRGLLIWTPVLVLLAPSVIRGWRQAPDWTRLLATGGAAYFALQGIANHFSGGDAFFAYRHGLELLVSLFPLYMVCLTYAGRIARAALGPVLGLQLGAMVVGSLPGSLAGTNVTTEGAWTHNGLVKALTDHPELWVIMVLCIT
ncbi:MAG: hypothetical protein ACSLFD_07165, partial [Solirubrobacterales bacterium]